MSAVAEIVTEIVDAAMARHQRNATLYWNALRDLVEWWESLPATLRQDIEGSGAMPGCIARAKRLIHPST
jgi:hypothetical protein